MIDRSLMERRARMLETALDLAGVKAMVIEVICDDGTEKFIAELTPACASNHWDLANDYLAWAMDACVAECTRTAETRVEIELSTRLEYGFPVASLQ